MYSVLYSFYYYRVYKDPHAQPQTGRRDLAGWTISQVGPAGPGPEPHTKMVNNMGEIVQYFFSQSVFMTNGLILQYLSTRNLSTRKGAKASAKACRVLSASPRRTV